MNITMEAEMVIGEGQEQDPGFGEEIPKFKIT